MVGEVPRCVARPVPQGYSAEKTCQVVVSAVSDYEEIFDFSFRRSRGNAVNGVPFRDAFVDNLLRSSPEVAQKMIHGDLETFRVTLMLSIDHLARYYLSREPSAILQGTARRQSKDERNIEPHLYEFFLQALLQTVQQYDPNYNEEVGKAWEVVLRPGLEYMKRMY
jgi:hypothetical protein